MTNENYYYIFSKILVFHHYKELLTREQMENDHYTKMYLVQCEPLRYGG